MTTIKNKSNLIQGFTANVRPKGRGFEVSYNYYDFSGKRRQKSKTYYSMEEAYLRKKELEYLHATKKLAQPSGITFHDLYERYLKLYAEANYKFSTYRNYKQMMTKHVLPVFGHRLIQDITPLDIEQFFNNMRNTKIYAGDLHRAPVSAHLKPSTLASLHSHFNQTLERAVEWNLLNANPLRCKRPSVKNKKHVIWAPEEVAEAISVMRHDGNDLLELALLISYVCSAREGEVAGLTWDNFNFENGTVHIDKEIQRVSRDALGNSKKEEPIYVFPTVDEQSVTVLAHISLKNKESDRIFKVPKPFMERIHERKAEYEKCRLAYGMLGEFVDYNLVFCHSNGKPYDPKRMNTWLLKFQKRHPQFKRIVFHGVRHSSTTYKLKLSGGDIKSVQAHTGHATTEVILDRYSHIVPRYSEDLRFNHKSCGI